MKETQDQEGARGRRVPGMTFLEWITAGVLLLVVLSVGWMILAAFQPALGRLADLEAEVVATLVLLTAALTLVSIVALRHTRG